MFDPRLEHKTENVPGFFQSSYDEEQEHVVILFTHNKKYLLGLCTDVEQDNNVCTNLKKDFFYCVCSLISICTSPIT